jgi:hypothetical protein
MNHVPSPSSHPSVLCFDIINANILIVILNYGLARCHHWGKSKKHTAKFLQLHMKLQLTQNKNVKIYNSIKINHFSFLINIKLYILVGYSVKLPFIYTLCTDQIRVSSISISLYFVLGGFEFLSSSCP